MTNNSTLSCRGNSTVSFISNKAASAGGALCCMQDSAIDVSENSNITFINNHASYGGAVALNKNCHIQISQKSFVNFSCNSAEQNGGALIFISYSTNTVRDNSMIIFNNNTALLGGAIYIAFSYLLIDGNSTVLLDNNTAMGGGGGLSIFYGINRVPTSLVTIRGMLLVIFDNINSNSNICNI